MTIPSVRLPPTGTYTIALDWAEHIEAQGDGRTLDSVNWALPAGLTESASSVSGTVATIAISTSGLTLGATYTVVCEATFDNSDVHQAEIDVVIARLNVKKRIA